MSLEGAGGIGGEVIADVPRGEDAILVGVQSALTGRPGVLAGARVLSYFGEHSLGWFAVCGLGALLQPQRRRAWVTAGVGTFFAHAAAVLIKRVVKRERPQHPAIAVNVGTPRSFEVEPRAMLEASLLGFSGDLYGDVAEVVFVRFLRAPQKFSSPDALVSAVLANIDWTRENLGESGVGGVR